MSTITLRQLRPDDSIDELTELLQRAFARLGAMGMDCSCVNQTSDITRQRIGDGACLIALADTRAGTRIVGTVTLQTADPQAEIAWYRHPSVASLHQLAVEPGHQGAGIGHTLLLSAAAWAVKQRCVELALDTPEPARHLHAYYAGQGFSRQSTEQCVGRNYRSVVLSKPVGRAQWRAPCQAPRLTKQLAWPPRHPAEMAVLAKQAR